MSDNDQQPQIPSKQTSSVPLKKETVRVTLKAADAPPAAPAATVAGAPVRPPTPPTAPPVPTAPPAAGPPRPPAPAPTIALRPAAPTAAGPTPTIRLATPTPSTPAIALKTATQPLGGPGLPKATVQLQVPTQPLSAGGLAASQMATLQVDDEDDEGSASGVLKVLSIVGFLAACVVLYFQIDTANTWIDAADRTEENLKGQYQLLLEAEPNNDQ